MEGLAQSVTAAAIVVVALLVVMGVVLTIVSFSRTRKQKAYFADLHQNLSVGDKVFFSGIYGVVKEISQDIVRVEVAPKCTIEVSRYAISQIVDTSQQQ